MQTTGAAEGSATSLTADGSPCIEEIRAQLKRIVSSPEFPGMGRAAAFLRYVVDEAIAGRAGRIKGYSIAIEVFGRNETFTQDDPVVRIEAGRLRRSLERYYLLEGQNDPVRIDIPKGGYTPAFSWNRAAPAEQETAPVPGQSSREPWWHAKRAVLAGFLAVLAASAAWMLGGLALAPPLYSSNDAVPDRPALVVAPFANLGDGPEAQLYAVGLTEELLTVLPRFKEIKVFGRETSKSSRVVALSWRASRSCSMDPSRWS